ncbi:hypothetical protein CROQUDRAFT_723718 [Cronartium quercuum f. sp. fusiforme G11]|uniref:Uncharacterized protein n=1 Tax=Cronartium quercuum f. sp. fusiforme G11 TaxID=708437 RepID=A0A9P6NJ64_9BASI|nr:hypothetical protein CROQUDRAFT_723718 [Cronartium quercuum f. sp. fusiforme G11]
MGDPFFQSEPKTGSQKRKRVRRGKTTIDEPSAKSSGDSKRERSQKRSGKLKARATEDEELDQSEGSEVELNAGPEDFQSDSEEEDAHETPAQKRLRLAQAYLNGLKQDQLREDGTFDAAEIDQEIISSRLQQDVLEASGKLHTLLGTKLATKFCTTTTKATSSSSTETMLDQQQPYKIFRTGKNHHRLPVTCAKLTKDGKRLFVSDKSGQIIGYDSSSIWLSTINSKNKIGLQKKLILKNHIPIKKLSGKEKYEKKKSSKGLPKTLSNVKEGDQFGHLGEILTFDLSDDGNLLASGGKDKLIGVWDISINNNKNNQQQDQNLKEQKTLIWKTGMRGHKDLISSVAFRSGSSTLYTASYDRMIKVFNLDSLTYSETLFGHQDSIVSISALTKETLVSAGSRDRTCRYWKIIDETQLVFRGGGGNSKLRDLIDGVGLDLDDDDDLGGGGGRNSKKNKKKVGVNDNEQNFVEGSIDCVCMIDDTMFLSGGDSGSISLWTTHKKKAIYTYPLAHGTETITVTDSPNESIIQARWITSIHCLPYSDIFVSGSWDGQVRLWRLTTGERGQDIKKFELIGSISIGPGIVNSLQIIIHKEEKGKRIQLAICIGLGQENRLGRWKKISEAKNQCAVAVLEVQ